MDTQYHLLFLYYLYLKGKTQRLHGRKWVHSIIVARPLMAAFDTLYQELRSDRKNVFYLMSQRTGWFWTRLNNNSTSISTSSIVIGEQGCAEQRSRLSGGKWNNVAVELRRRKVDKCDRVLRYCLWAASLSLTAREQAELNQVFLPLLLEKVWGIYNSMPGIITSVMRSAQRKGSLTWKQ